MASNISSIDGEPHQRECRGTGSNGCRHRTLGSTDAENAEEKPWEQLLQAPSPLLLPLLDKIRHKARRAFVLLNFISSEVRRQRQLVHCGQDVIKIKDPVRYCALGPRVSRLAISDLRISDLRSQHTSGRARARSGGRFRFRFR
jgi:hypothetical protein